ncbi:unnamed protein product [Tilletia laevis]|uniref:Chromatin modification-related protein n=3 Tax=Tilletia TaxID=13289 RepID=A0A8X7SV97_9BASI|nr:hypothetical protein CF336_g5877 [Tilletia laevis]KAE8192196.1 hypothetical protein CF328_g5449 [Tilletia controversa]KAE8261214.1 hypothetical protein A4X03_0g3447 [Tilletia caries]KAE8195291.1 hypothetical protein CF335_g5131 [Tilletia laevis]KAE8243409.1 hypothetical protein A4X06_0g6336 [Tilletia controversa]
MSVSDSAELAALAVEYVHSLDNVPHQVSHLLKEIEHKDIKCQELMPKVADRELQYRKLINTLPPGPWTGLSGTPTTSSSSAATAAAGVGGGSTSATTAGGGTIAETLERADKLAEKLSSDYTRLEEWSIQKAALSQKLWSILYAHHVRCKAELGRIDTKVLANVRVPPPVAGLMLQPPPLLAALIGVGSAASSGNGNGSGIPTGGIPGTPTAAGGFAATAAGVSSGRAGTPGIGSLTLLGGGHSTAVGTPTGEMSYFDGPTSSTPHKGGPSRRGGGSGAGAGGGGGRLASGSNASSGGPSRSSFVRAADGGGDGSSAGEVDAGEKGEGEEKDESPYCFCRQVSFGEMIGCDSDTCKIEWFHIGCVGVSKPLPATWYCEDCLKQMSSSQQKKRKRQV